MRVCGVGSVVMMVCVGGVGMIVSEWCGQCGCDGNDVFWTVWV